MTERKKKDFVKRPKAAKKERKKERERERERGQNSAVQRV
jgi:hypothetical protein